MDSASISCAKVTKKFAGGGGVEEVSLEIAGGICALLGPNGAGKSTLLKLLAGLMLPDAGAVKVGGLSPAESPRPIKQALGVLPEELGVFDDLSILEHLKLTGPIYGLSGDETAARAADLLGLLRLEGSQHTRLRDCSYGMRKKTGVALALLHDPRFVLLDEPFEGIDPASTLAIQRTFEDIAARGTTVLFTSHLLSLVEQIATRVILLNHGRIAFDQAMDKLERPLAELYFHHVGVEGYEPLSWLGSGVRGGTENVTQLRAEPDTPLAIKPERNSEATSR